MKGQNDNNNKFNIYKNQNGSQNNISSEENKVFNSIPTPQKKSSFVGSSKKNEMEDGKSLRTIESKKSSNGKNLQQEAAFGALYDYIIKKGNQQNKSYFSKGSNVVSNGSNTLVINSNYFNANNGEGGDSQLKRTICFSELRKVLTSTGNSKSGFFSKNNNLDTTRKDKDKENFLFSKHTGIEDYLGNKYENQNNSLNNFITQCKNFDENNTQKNNNINDNKDNNDNNINDNKDYNDNNNNNVYNSNNNSNRSTQDDKSEINRDDFIMIILQNTKLTNYYGTMEKLCNDLNITQVKEMDKLSEKSLTDAGLSEKNSKIIYEQIQEYFAEYNEKIKLNKKLLTQPDQENGGCCYECLLF